MGRLIVYCITNKINNKRYIGIDSHGNNRWRDHKRTAKRNKLNSKQLIDRKIYEYGIDNFEYEILTNCSSINEMKKREQFFISKYNTYVGDDNGYNLTFGGDGCFGFKMPEEKIHREKTHYMFGKKQPKELNRQRSKTMKGKNIGDKNVFKRPEVRKKLSEFAKTRLKEKNPNFRYHIDKNDLYFFYIKCNHSLKNTTKKFKCSETTIIRRLKEYGISKR